MPLRLAEIIVPEDVADEAEALLVNHGMPFVARSRLEGGLVRLDTVCSMEDTESVLDAFEERFGERSGIRVMLLAVEATLPRGDLLESRAEGDPPESSSSPPGEDEATEEESGKRRSRVHREEVYSELKHASKWSGVFSSTVVLSTIVAAVGLMQSSTAAVIGAMVIAPLLGPNMALALGTTLGDRALIFDALRTSFGGLLVGLGISLLAGLLFRPDLAGTEIALRTDVDLPDLVLALASGAAGALGFTTGAPAALIGVMVAVALMPPLVVFGFTLAAWDLDLAWGSGMLLLANIICVNLAATLTFRFQGLTPRPLREGERARRFTWFAGALWTALLLAAIGVILYAKLV